MPLSLVTGGAGFIGSHVADTLLTMGHEVVVADDLSGGSKENVPDGAEFVRGDISDYQFVDQLFESHHFDYVYHLAAYAAEGLSHFIKRYNYENNLIASVNLINASVRHEVKCFVFTSSIAVYGAQQNPVTENSPTVPEDPYGIAKLAVEQELKVTRDMFGLEYVIFRPHNVYGERQNISDKYRNVVGIFMSQLIGGQPLTIFGDGTQTRAFSYVRDIAPVMAQSAENANMYGEIFNLGSDQVTSVNHLASMISEEFSTQAEIRHLDKRHEVEHIYASHEKIMRYIDDHQPTSLNEGIHQMAQWAKSIDIEPSKHFNNLELKKNIPPSWL